MKNLLFVLLILFGSVSFGQLSYEHFKDVYKPHYEILIKNYTPVETFNGLGSGSYGAALIYLYDESLKNKDLQTNISGILTSADTTQFVFDKAIIVVLIFSVKLPKFFRKLHLSCSSIMFCD